MVKDIIGELFPPDMPRVMRWRMLVFLMVGVLILHAARADGFFEVMGINGYAMAADIEAVKGELQQQIKDVDTKVETVNRKVDQTNDDVKAILKLQIQSRLRALQEAKCGNHSDDRLRRLMERELDDLQNQHVALTGYVYTVEAC